MDQTPKPKRPRLLINCPSDPSTPLPNGLSPFQNASLDVIEKIFRLTDDIKTKMGLEIVCSKFRSRIVLPRCWIYEKTLKLEYNEHNNKVSINGTEFDGNEAPYALATFLQRAVIHQVKVQSIEWPANFALGLESQIRAYKQSFSLRTVKFSLSGELNDDCIPLLSGFAECDLSQMKKIYVGPDEITEGFQTQFWSFVFACPNLTTLSLLVAYGCGVDDNFDEIQTYCPKIEKFEMQDYISDGVTDPLTLFLCNLQHLKSIFFSFVKNGALFHLLDDATRSRIETLKIALESGPDEEEEDMEEAKEAFLITPTLFPNLKKFVPSQAYGPNQYWTTEVCGSLIQNIIDNFGDRGAYELTILLRVENKENLVEVVRDMNCQVLIEGEILKCVKGDLVIIVEFDDVS